MSKNVLNLSGNQARKFFLKEESYFNSDLPPYFQFSDLLQKISKKLKDKRLSDFYNSTVKPKYCEDVNYRLITNKDGKYAWRPLQLIHPAFYVSLVHEITEEKNWKTIVDRFNFFKSKSKNIKCESIPLITNQYKKDKAAQIIHWLGEVERQSICNSLEYDYLFHTDIVDCYGSIYTHSIAWALHGKPDAKEDRGKDKKLIGNIVDKKIEDMSYGQTNGIPQGSVLMDFISEMVLCYIDSLLSENLTNFRKDYKIIRYRDDYRIFVNNPQVGEQIIKKLSELIHDFGMKINSSKTKISDHITHNSLKEDKLYWMIHETSSDNLLSQLYKISFVAQRFPNSGKVTTLLKAFYDEIFSLSKNDVKSFNITVLISILVDIAYKNPRTYPIISATLSKFIDFLPKSKKGNVVRKILNKFKKIPNTGIMQLWLQRITINSDFDDLVYSERLCQKVTDSSVSIWNSEWLQKSLKSDIDSCDLIDKKKLRELSGVIESKEIELFDKFESF